MKNKKFLPIILIVSAFTISGCGSKQSSPEQSSVEPSTQSISSSEPISSSSEERKSSDSSSSSISSSSSSASSSSSSSASSSSSSSSSSIPTPEYFSKDIQVDLEPGLKKGESLTPYTLVFNYNDEYFLKDPKEYDKDLSMLSLGASIASGDILKGTAFFTEAGFKDITGHDYDKQPSIDTMGYFMAHKTIDNYELVTVSFRGFNYGMEWANNFTIGKTGDHEGFAARGAEAYQALKTYLNNYANGKSLKLWINGYSRAGALSNALASLILRNNELSLTQDNMFVYTFEAPAALIEDNALPYQNVHNIVNDADLITFIPPAQYGLYRCGVEHGIYDPNVTTLMKEFDSEIEVPEFQEVNEKTTNDELFRDYILDSIFNHEIVDESDTEKYANTREQYVDNYQTGLSNGIGYIFALTASTRAALLDDMKNLGFGAISIIGDETGAAMADFIKTYLDRDGVIYDPENLQADCAVLVKAIGNLFLTLVLSFIAGGAITDDLNRLLDMHYPETTYVLLKNSHLRMETEIK